MPEQASIRVEIRYFIDLTSNEKFNETKQAANELQAALVDLIKQPRFAAIRPLLVDE